MLGRGMMKAGKRLAREIASRNPRTGKEAEQMKSFLFAAATAASFVVVPGVAAAGPIERACMASDRGGNRSLCGCIQQAADMTLSGGDQKRAAKFFKDPEAAHATWVSQSKSDDAFWERYKSFGQTAEAYCGG
ncbi:hypothetical protein [Tabrizicola thermarum]|uniref:hypothetical protein n=1 Tax=Tabrizicola thermarum TaxID=2670345 RepID=UPI001EE4267F|nr:hypothetical protein [Tabrizicola thermarum]